MKLILSTFTFNLIFCLIVIAQTDYFFIDEYETERICILTGEDLEIFDMNFDEVNLEEHNLEELEDYHVEITSPNEYSNELIINLNNAYTISAQSRSRGTFNIELQAASNPTLGSSVIEGEGKLFGDSLILYCKIYSSYENLNCKIVGIKKEKEAIVSDNTYPIPTQNAEYGSVSFQGPPGIPGSGSRGSIYKYDGIDTLINNQIYQYWQGEFTRYENNKLYIIEYYNNQFDSIAEMVYYDFNLEEKDSFLIPYWNTYAQVSRVSLFTALNGQKRKQINLSVSNTMCGASLKWIEGIGDVTNGFFYTSQIGLCDIYNSIVCFSDSSGNVYELPHFDYPCDSLDTYTDIVNSITDDLNHNSEITIFPNPAKRQINLSFTKNVEPILNAYTIYNLNGSVVLQNEINSTTKTIDVSSLKNGNYIINFTNSVSTIVSKRFVKME